MSFTACVRARSSLPARGSFSLFLSPSFAGLLVGTGLERGPTISRIVWFYVSTQSAVQSRACVSVQLSPDRVESYALFDTRTGHAHKRGRRVRGPPYCPRASSFGVLVGYKGDGAMGRETGPEKGSARRREISGGDPLFPLPPPVPLAGRARGTRSFFTFKNHDDAHFSDS